MQNPDFVKVLIHRINQKIMIPLDHGRRNLHHKKFPLRNKFVICLLCKIRMVK